MNNERETLEKLIQITNEFRSYSNDIGDQNSFGPNTAICQDAMIFGIDVEDYVAELENEFGEFVWQIPWGNFTDQTFSFRGCGTALLPFHLIWRMIRWSFVGGEIIPKPDPKNFPKRLELAHIAKVIDQARWEYP